MEGETLLDVQHSPMFKLKRKILIMALFLQYFFGGLEYSVTIPAAFLDRKYSSSDRSFMVLEAGLYPFAAIITSLLFAHIYDRTKQIRRLLIILNVFQIIGNLLHAIDYWKSLPLFGRFIAGLGDGFVALSVGEITYLYDAKERVGILCFFELGRVAGFMIGPAVNYFIIKWSTHHQWSLHTKSLPGFIMGCCWAVMTLITLCCVHNLALEIIDKFKLNDSPFLKRKYSHQEMVTPDENTALLRGEYVNEEIEDQEGHKDEKVVDDCEADGYDSDNSLIGPDYGAESEIDTKDIFEKTADEIFPVPDREPALSRRERFKLYVHTTVQNTKQSLRDALDNGFHSSHLGEICYIEIVVLITVNFVFWFSQVTFVVLCSYVTTFQYKFGPHETGAIYLAGGILMLCIFCLMYAARGFLAKHNLYVIILPLALIQISLALLIYEVVPKDMYHRTLVFIFIAVLVFSSIPVSLACFKSLLTGLVRPGLQGTLQGIASMIAHLAIISGLLLHSYTSDNRQVYGAVMTFICFFSIISFFLSFDRIYRRQRESAEKLSF